jgi:hypothetical protein
LLAGIDDLRVVERELRELVRDRLARGLTRDGGETMRYCGTDRPGQPAPPPPSDPSRPTPREAALLDVRRAADDFERATERARAEVDRARLARRYAFRKALNAGATLREVGTAAGISHVRVRELAQGSDRPSGL